MYASVILFVISGDSRVVYLGVIIISFLLYSSDTTSPSEDYVEQEAPVSWVNSAPSNPYPDTAPILANSGSIWEGSTDPRYLAGKLARDVQQKYQDRQFTPQVRAPAKSNISGYDDSVSGVAKSYPDFSALAGQFGTGFRGTDKPTNILRGQGLPFGYPGTQNSITNP
jgi:hypothetical protein